MKKHYNTNSTHLILEEEEVDDIMKDDQTTIEEDLT